MRFLYYILTLAVLLVGCKRTDMGGVQDSGTMTFNASLAGMVQSRAVSAIDFDTYGINIAGYHTQGKFAEAIAADATLVFPNIFDYDRADNQIPVPLVTKKDDKFTLSTVKWGLDQTSYLSYFAWTQGKTADAVNGIVNATKDNTTTGYPWIDVVNSSDYSKQVDIAAARHVDERNHRVISAVDLDFKHILSKVTLKFKSSAGAKVAISKMDLSYGANMIFNKGRYTFNTNPADSIGHFSGLSGYHTGKTSLGTSHALDNGAEVVVGDLLLIPQAVKQGFLSFDLTYAISSSTGSYTFNKQVLLPASELLSGTNHIYTVDIYGEQIIVHQSLVSDWIIDATPRLPFVPGARNDTQILLDGYDKPYQHVDGVWYWLDRSGYNRHVELKNMDGTSYDVDAKHYAFIGSADAAKRKYGIIPAIGTLTNVTLQIIVEAKDAAFCDMFLLSPISPLSGGAGVTAKERYFHSAFGWNNTGDVYIDSGGAEDFAASGTRLKHTYGAAWSPLSLQAVWTFMSSNNPNEMRLYRNKEHLKTEAMKATNRISSGGPLISNRLAFNFSGNIRHLRIVSTPMDHASVILSNDELRAKYHVPTSTLTGTLVGRFGGKLVATTIGSEVHYHFDKNLYVETQNEPNTYKWAQVNGYTGARDLMNGTSNTYNKLNDFNYPAARVCINKLPSGEWFAPAKNQMMALWLVPTALGSGVGSSTSLWGSAEADNDYGYLLRLSDGKGYNIPKTNTNSVRCVREVMF